MFEKGTLELSVVCRTPVVSTRRVQTRPSSKCDRLIHSSQCPHTNLGNAPGLPAETVGASACLRLSWH